MRFDYFVNWGSKKYLAERNVDILWFIVDLFEQYISTLSYGPSVKKIYCSFYCIDSLSQIIASPRDQLNYLRGRKTIAASMFFLSDEIVITSIPMDRVLKYIEDVFIQKFTDLKLLEVDDFDIDSLIKDTGLFFDKVRREIKTIDDVPSSRDPNSPLMRKLLAYLNS